MGRLSTTECTYLPTYLRASCTVLACSVQNACEVDVHRCPKLTDPGLSLPLSLSVSLSLPAESLRCLCVNSYGGLDPRNN